MLQPLTNQVLIVGAGPTGLMMAAQLVYWGIRARVIEANAAPLTQTRAVGVQARTVEIFEQMGLSDSALANGLPAQAVNIFGEHGKLGHIPLGEMGKGLSPFPYMLILPQDRTESILREDLKTHGIEVEWNTRLESFSQAAEGVSVNLQHDGQIETAHFRYVIGADGVHSQVRNGLDLKFVGSTYEHRFFVADLQISGEPVEGELNIFFSNKFFVLAMFPLQGTRRFRLVGVFPANLVNTEHPSFEDIHPYLIKMAGELMQFDQVNEFSTYHVHHRVVEQFKRGNCFLMGDAAHVHSPVGGQGMNTGLQDANNLGWKLALVLRGEAKVSLLDTYHEERYPNALRLVNTTDRAFTFIVSTGRLAKLTRMWVLPMVTKHLVRFKGVQRFAFRTVSQTTLNYRGHRLSQDRLNGKVKAGDRFPWFLDNGQDVYRQLNPTGFTLFALGDWQGQKANLENLASARLSLRCLTRREDYAKTGLTDGLYLVRPDGYIGLSTTDPEDIRPYLKTTIGLIS